MRHVMATLKAAQAQMQPKNDKTNIKKASHTNGAYA